MWVGRCRLQGFKQRQVTLNQCLEKPVLFQGVSFCRPHIGEVGVENQSECPVVQAASQSIG